MKRNPLDMNYSELNDTLDMLLKLEGLPSSVNYKGDRINYNRYNKSRLIITGLYKLIEAAMFYRNHINRRLGNFKKAGFLKSFKPYFYIFRIGLPDLLSCLGGKFDKKLAANYIIAAMLYDTSCDIPEYKKYLKEFNNLIMFDKNIESTDKYLTLFKEATDYIKSALDKQTYNTFMNYIKIEHISQLMSMYQLSDKTISKDDLFKITLAKGGITIMAGMYIMAPKMTKKERKAIYEVGGVLQILEDIKDIKEDLNIGIQTMSNQQMINYQEMKQLYFGSVNNLIEKCNLNPNHPNSTLDIFYYLINHILEKRYAPLFKI